MLESKCKFGKKHGTFYLFENFICFSAQVFGRITKKKIAISSITKPPQSFESSSIKVYVRNDKFIFQFEEQGDAQIALAKLIQIWKSIELEKIEKSDGHTIQIDFTENKNELVLTTPSQTLVVSFSQKKELDVSDFIGTFKRLVSSKSPVQEINENVDKQDLSSDEWDLILDGARNEEYEYGQPILKSGERVQRLYQILEGICNVEINKDGKSTVINSMEKGEIFGELNFVLAEETSANVIASSEKVVVRVIEGYFVNMLFSLHPQIAGKFYKFIACQIISRLDKKNKLQNSSSNLKTKHHSAEKMREMAKISISTKRLLSNKSRSTDLDSN